MCREQLGFEPPTRQWRSKAVTLPYMLQFGGEKYLETKMRDASLYPTRKALWDLLQDYVEERTADSQEVKQVARNEE
jgi:hypothetical protein